MYHEFCGIYQIAKSRYGMTYTVKYTQDDCILCIYRDAMLVFRVTEETAERMYKVATERLKSYITLNEKDHASSSTKKE